MNILKIVCASRSPPSREHQFLNILAFLVALTVFSAQKLASFIYGHVPFVPVNNTWSKVPRSTLSGLGCLPAFIHQNVKNKFLKKIKERAGRTTRKNGFAASQCWLNIMFIFDFMVISIFVSSFFFSKKRVFK